MKHKKYRKTAIMNLAWTKFIVYEHLPPPQNKTERFHARKPLW